MRSNALNRTNVNISNCFRCLFFFELDADEKYTPRHTRATKVHWFTFLNKTIIVHSNHQHSLMSFANIRNTYLIFLILCDCWFFIIFGDAVNQKMEILSIFKNANAECPNNIWIVLLLSTRWIIYSENIVCYYLICFAFRAHRRNLTLHIQFIHSLSPSFSADPIKIMFFFLNSVWSLYGELICCKQHPIALPFQKLRIEARTWRVWIEL